MVIHDAPCSAEGVLSCQNVWGVHSAFRKPWVQFPAPNKAGMVVHPCNSSIPEWRQEDLEFEVVLARRLSS